jgi:hypothetical protein
MTREEKIAVVERYIHGLGNGDFSHVQQRIVEGEYVATVFHLRTPNGVTTVFDKFRVVDGKLKEINPYYDPSILNAAVTTYLAPPASGVSP